MTLKALEKKLQKADAKQAVLYLFCNFVSLVLITAYSAMMFSPTVLTIFPDGGDSRKQMIAIFMLTLFGCVVFTIYASGLFFRQKARQLGTLMALGASRHCLLPGLLREVLALSSFSSFAGILAGFPFIWLLWNGFRLFIIDSTQMILTFDFKCLFLSAVFFVLVAVFSCITAYRYLKKTNIMEVMHEEHRSEPVKELGIWCGPAGIVLTLAGAVTGYLAPAIYQKLFHAYAPIWINVFYAPLFAGLYMIMLHTVVHGWRSRQKQPYKNLIARSIMKFQGKQTVNSLLVCTVLIAGSAFAIFYIPMMSAGQLMEIKSRPYDYYYHYRADQNIPDEEEISTLAGKHGLAIKDYKSAPYLSLAMDGITEIEDEGNSFHYERVPFCNEAKFISETSFEILTGEKASVEKGSYRAISNADETGLYYLNSTAVVLTNMSTFESIPVSFAGYAHYDLLADSAGYYVLSDEDYETISLGLAPDWMGAAAFFNMDGEDSYAFAQDFFYTLVSAFDSECELPAYYDRVTKYYKNLQGEVYWGDTPDMTQISYSQPDSSDFRSYWRYMPKSRILDRTDFTRNFSVFLMMFLFIAIICSLAAMIISYIRCMTIALNNRYLFEDLKRLGASPAFLQKEIKGQAGPVFKIPAIAGMTAMYLLYLLLLWGNDGKITGSEAVGMAVCFFILAGIAAAYYLVYRCTVRNMFKFLF
ncbi:MAG: ABC transporter permease [Lachnospiraceae bacterium]|nr:ABC transporter permease [Lachnospiraceae bacterium]